MNNVSWGTREVRKPVEEQAAEEALQVIQLFSFILLIQCNKNINFFLKFCDFQQIWSTVIIQIEAI